jgi:hypothetical protein
MFSRRSNAVAPEPVAVAQKPSAVELEKDAEIARLQNIIKDLEEKLKPKKTAMSVMETTIRQTIEAGFEKKRVDTTAILNDEIKAKDILINCLDVQVKELTAKTASTFLVARCAWCLNETDVTSDDYNMGAFRCGCMVCKACAITPIPAAPNSCCRDCPIHNSSTSGWQRFKITA